MNGNMVQLGYDVERGTEYVVSLQTSTVLRVNSEELIGTTEYQTLYTRHLINRCRYNRVRLHVYFS